MGTAELTTVFAPSTIIASPIRLEWNESMPVFAKEEFLEGVGDEYGWLGGFDERGQIRCVLPYTILVKAALRMVRFRVATIRTDAGLDLHEERRFLNSAVVYFREESRADVIIPASNNAIFQTYPDGAIAAPYGTYVIDLQQEEDALWRNISKTTRQNITAAQRDGVRVFEGPEFLEPAYDVIRETFGRSRMAFMKRDAFRRFALALGQHSKVMVADYRGAPQSYSLFAFSVPSAYWIYGGSIQRPHPGAMKLLQWEAIRLFRALHVRKFDFFGARINPLKGSKQEAINLMKKRLGATLEEGYMWRQSLRPWRASLYSIGVRLLRGGDIVDQEKHKLKAYCPKQQVDSVARPR